MTTFGAVHSIKLAFYCSEMQCLETICYDPQLNQGFRQYIVLLLQYQQVPQQLRINATTSGLRDLPRLVPLSIFCGQIIEKKLFKIT